MDQLPSRERPVTELSPGDIQRLQRLLVPILGRTPTQKETRTRRDALQNVGSLDGAQVLVVDDAIPYS